VFNCVLVFSSSHFKSFLLFLSLHLNEFFYYHEKIIKLFFDYCLKIKLKGKKNKNYIINKHGMKFDLQNHVR
jgi:hypothetical protein